MIKDQIVENVIGKFRSRSARGIVKYGTTFEQNSKDNYLLHLQEELMDACNYIEKLLTLQQEITTLVKLHPDDSSLGAAVRKLVS